MVQPFIVAPDNDSFVTNDNESFTLLDNSSFGAESLARDGDEVVHVREDTPPPSVQRRLFVGGDGDTSTASSASQSHQRRRSGSGSGLRFLCCGLFTRRHSRPHTINPPTAIQPSTSIRSSAPMTQTRVPIAHTTIPEEGEEDEEEQDNDQENQPPTIIETLVGSNNEHTLAVEQEQEQEQEEVQAEGGGASRRHSVRHSWVTVSRWLE